MSAAPADASQIQVRLAPPDVFNRVGVARPAFLSSLHFTPSVQGGKPVILVTSDRPIQEPFVNFLLEVSWPQGQLLKEYTVMLDPPVLMQPGNTVAGDATVRAEPKAAGNVRRPSRQASTQPAAPSGQPAASGSGRNRTYRVRSGDTLFRVASRLQQPGVSNDQMMMALFRANPNAFIGENINNLRTGATLKAPASGDAGDISRAEARRQIRQQNAEWREFRKSLAGKTVPQQSTGTTSASKPSAPTAATRNTAGKTDDKARLEVLGAQAAGSEAKNAAVAAGNAKLAALEKQLALANESLTARQNENKDLKSRVTDLESMLSKKNRLLALRDNQLAELQQQLAANGIKTAPLAETPEAQDAAAQQAATRGNQQPSVPGTPTPAPDQGKDIQTHMANVAGKDNDAVLRGEQPPAASGQPAAVTPPGGTPTGVQPPAGTPPVVAANPNPPANASSSLVPLTPPVENTPPKPVNKPAVVPVTPISEPEDKKPASAFVDETKDSNDLLGMLTSPLALKIGAGSLALLLLLWLLGRRRKPDGADSAKAKDRFANLDDELDGPLIEEEPLDLGTLESELDKAEQRGSRGYGATTSHGQTDPFGIRDDGDNAWDEGAHVPVSASHDNTHGSETEDDLLTEANVYIAYGLYQQAESELKKGIERQPDKLEYRHKLLECYFSANNREAFDNQAQQFASMNGPNKAALWKSIADWGRKISPDNKLYQGDGSNISAVATTVATALGGMAAAGAAAVAAADDTVPHAVEEHPLKPVEPVETHGRHVAEEHPLKPVEPVAEHGRDGFAGAPVMDDDFGDLELGDLDFDDIDLDKLLQDGESADVEPPAPQAVMSTLPDLPDLSAGQQPHQLAANSSELEEETFDLENLDDDLDLDFDLDLPDAPSQPLLDVDAAKGGNGSASGVLDFSLDDDADEHKADTPVAGAVAAAAIAAPAVAAAAGNSTNLNLHLDNNTGITRILPKDTFYAPISEEDKDWLGDIDDALSFLDFPDEEIDLHEAHISTKLDLARAYLDMGDIEGARSTLEEVMVEGNDDQRREAEVLLHQTG
ncbi:FimV/HubP family polar landmark protein [Candidatus Thiothrix sp. Deng01]|uniref:FimV/HubP family polar landmark protein n=1 Tax=Candidatus Thiothrix phosphatis TaxID=3112415 RepID=A0ABU6D502_9GAMM|nr:FimV/HubP family polar landmark protein [Candidatus Thiothrix sp. Deng01]MEB4593373.1 FimV/HubP family polar landmark protein [Candidatus Thiothrix sp. Deng01]